MHDFRLKFEEVLPESDQLVNAGSAHAAADAHGDHGIFSAGAAQLIQGLDGQEGTGSALG